MVGDFHKQEQMSHFLKILKISLIIPVIILASASSLKAEAGRLMFSISGGISYNTGPGAYESYWRPVFSLGGGVGYKVASFLIPQVSVDYSLFSLDSGSYKNTLAICRYDNANCSVKGGNLSFTTVAATVKFFIPRGRTQFSPYARPGLGYSRGVKDKIAAHYSGDITDNNPSLSDDHIWAREVINAMFLTFGFGLDYYIAPKACIFIESEITVGIYQMRGMGFIPISLGMSFWI
jgi:hypothetical protein